jgi:hypothetical protein
VSVWEDRALAMDQAVDEHLGDTIQASFNAGATFAPTMGFVLPDVEGGDLRGFDEPLGSRVRVKLARAAFPGGRLPSYDDDRFQHPRLGAGLFRPAGSEPREQGRYYIFDVQKA